MTPLKCMLKQEYSERLNSKKEPKENLNDKFVKTRRTKYQQFSSEHDKNNISNRKMKLHLITFIVLSLFLLLSLELNSRGEAKKIKLKDLKKLRKYAFLLAPQSKRLYAIPFPVPLPVFVKRQQIYTQIPVLPRYVQQPYYSFAPAAAPIAAYPMPVMSDPYVDSYASHSEPASYQQQQQQHSQEQQEYEKVSSGKQQSSGKSGATSSKYLSQLASAIGRAYPVLGASGSQRNVVGKLLSGQAKVLSPSALLSSLKPSTVSPEQLDKQQPEESSKVAESTGSGQIVSAPSHSQLYVNPFALSAVAAAQQQQLPVRYPAYQYRRQRPPKFSGSLNAAYLYPHHQYLQGVLPRHPHHHIHHPTTQAQLLHSQMARELAVASMLNTVESPTTSQWREAQLQELQQTDSPMSSSDYEVLPVQTAVESERIIQEQQLVDAMRKLKQSEEARVAQNNSYALMAKQLGLPILPSQQLRVISY